MPTKGAADPRHPSLPDADPIAITGLGLIAAGADSPSALWHLASRGISPLSIHEGDGKITPPLPVCAISDPLPSTEIRLRRGHRADRTNRLALLASLRAWQDSGLAKSGISHDRIAVVVGTSRGPFRKWIEESAPSGTPRKTRTRVLPSLAADSTLASLHGGISAAIGAEGPAYTVSTACASGAHAIALAANHIRSGSASVALVGGVDAPLHPVLLRQFLATGILDSTLPPGLPCRPFDQTASGTILGEAGAFLVLESLASAHARRATIHGLLAGWGLAADGKSSSAETAGARALARAVNQAVSRAAISPSDIGYINTHGTATRRNDDLELQWLSGFLPPEGIPYSSTKPVTGHCLGATPVLEAILCLQALRHRSIPLNAHCPTPHPSAPPGLALTPDIPLNRPFALSASLGFWGACAALLFSLPE